MTTIAQDEPRRVTGGVDTHKDIHVAAVLDVLRRLIATAGFPATRHGYRRLVRWLQSHGELDSVGIEGCGSGQLPEVRLNLRSVLLTVRNYRRQLRPTLERAGHLFRRKPCDPHSLRHWPRR